METVCCLLSVGRIWWYKISNPLGMGTVISLSLFLILSLSASSCLSLSLSHFLCLSLSIHAFSSLCCTITRSSSIIFISTVISVFARLITTCFQIILIIPNYSRKISIFPTFHHFILLTTFTPSLIKLNFSIVKAVRWLSSGI